jgi:fucose permease
VPLAEILRLARNPLVLAFGLLLFFESGNEFILAGYVSTYLARDLGASVSTASYLLALYWAAVIGARMALSRLLLRVGGATTVMVSGLVAALGVVLLLAARGETMAATALVVAGCGVATIFPTTLGLAGSRFEESSGTVFGILFAIALTGGISLPWTLGRLAEAQGFRAALLLPAAGFIAIAAIQAAIARRA